MSTRSLITPTSKDVGTEKFKVVILGDESSGKTSIIRRAVDDKFSKEYEATLGVDLFTKTICTPGQKDIRLQVWDTSGQERFKSSIPSYIRDCHIAIIAFDVTTRGQYDSIEKWVTEVSELREQDEVWIFIVGTKCDLPLSQRCFTQQEIDEKLNELQRKEAPNNNIVSLSFFI
ncbi:unnamed protein product [Pseudo-nitzschia multistriata]|uniref:Uncharacterized protein n=1 Tax=Pseudo-nitzschia multistriata TaxID=183589 RepID=A0A448Z283_9STRA|nr:unnamed protein product [Pseudo-nitzschia multistriata]